MPRPNLFVVGAPKSGTTALCSYLARHPEVFMCPVKEPHFYSRDFASSFKGTHEDYLALFDRAPRGARWRVDGSTGYLRSACAIPDIIADAPDARFVAMLRNPVDMAFSLHAERVKHFDEDVMCFRTALALEETRRSGFDLPKDCPEPKLLQYRWFCRLGEQVRDAMGAIPPGNLHVILFDDFRRSPREEYQRLLGFLGLSDDGQREFEKVNERRDFRWPAIELSLRWIRRVRMRLGIDKGLGIHARINRYNLVPGEATMAMDTRRELAEYFTADVRMLETLLGRDLSHWLAA